VVTLTSPPIGAIRAPEPLIPGAISAQNDPESGGDDDSDSDSEPDDDEVENQAILGRDDAPVVIDLTALEWNETPMPDPIEPQSTRATPVRQAEHPTPRFTPGSRNFSGPKLPNCSRKTPKELFCEFFDDTVMETFVRETNSFALDTKIPNWKDVNKAELFKFFAILMVFGISCPSERRMAWDSELFRIPIVCNLMSRTRFEQIMRAWHYTNSANLSQAELRRRNAEDPFWSVEPLVKHISSVCMRCYHCGQHISIDEQCIPCKCRHKCRCYNPNKPDKWHLKVFAINDASNGYQWNFYLYRGKDEDRPPEYSATMWPVIKLTHPEIIHGKWHILYTDNWYSSLPLSIEMLKRSVHTVGTTKGNIRGAPKEHQFKRTGPQKKSRGEMKQVKTIVEDKPFYYTAWMDKKPVHILSTFAVSAEEVKRNGKSKRGQYEELALHRPGIVGIYNYGMGGTDRFDQKLSYYRIKLRTRKWKRKIYSHMMNIAIVNSHILYKESRNLDRYHHLFSLLHFQEALINQLGFPDNTEPIPLEAFLKSHLKRRTLDTCLRDHQRVHGFHEPLIMKRPRESGQDIRRKCLWCSKEKISTMCKTCNVPLCIETLPNDEEGESCYWLFHHAKLASNK
jgi:hypothetical protein